MLRELYNNTLRKDLEIYQVSLDADEHYWKTSAANLPWVCVRDGNGVYSTNVAVYNVRQVPSIFLINRNNELKASRRRYQRFRSCRQVIALSCYNLAYFI